MSVAVHRTSDLIRTSKVRYARRQVIDSTREVVAKFTTGCFTTLATGVVV